MPKTIPGAKTLSPVLLIEDSPDDIEFARRAFAKCATPPASGYPTLVVAEDGETALAMLLGEGSLARPLAPAFILLDLNVPGLDGRDLLKLIKRDERLRSIPVIVLTTSTRRGDIDSCYQLGANSYHQKPTDFRAYEETIRQIAEYWLSAAIAPVVDVELELISQKEVVAVGGGHCR